MKRTTDYTADSEYVQNPSCSKHAHDWLDVLKDNSADNYIGEQTF